MRHDKLRMIIVLAAIVGALTGVLAVALPSLAASSHHSKKTNKTATTRGPRGYRGRTGPSGPAGPAGPEGPPGALAVPVSINWFGGANAAGYGTASPVTIPGIGTLSAECDNSAQQLVLTPASSAGTRTVGNVTTLQGEGTDGISSNERLESYGASTPIVIPLPGNGMLTGTFGVEPDYGAGGAGPGPASFIFSAERILNNPNSADDYCAVAGQLTESGS